MQDPSLEYERNPEPGLSRQDRSYLRFLEVAHLVVGLLVLIPFAAIFAFGTCMIPMHGLADEPGVSGLGLLIRTAAIGGAGLVTGLLIYRSGRHIRARTRRQASMTISAMQVALGSAVLASAAMRAFAGRRSAVGWTALAVLFLPMLLIGVMSLLVLSRRSVRAAYDARINDPPTDGATPT